MWLAILLLVASCTSVPREDLDAYDKAFTQAKLAGDLVLDKVAPIIARREEGGVNAGCPITSGGYRTCFDALGILSDGRSNDPRSILVRRAALQTIADYNAVLLAIADGRFTVGNRAQFDNLVASGKMLVQLASIAVPGVPSLFSDTAIGALGVLFDRLQSARSALEVRRAVVDGAPIVQDMLAALAADTPTLYDIYLTAKKIEITAAAVKGLPDMQRRATAEINAYYDSLQQYVTILNATSEALDTLKAVAIKGGQVSPANIREIIGQAASIQTQADAFWRAASAAPN